MIDRLELVELLVADGFSTKTARIYSGNLARADSYVIARGHTLDDAPPTLIRSYADTVPRTRSTLAALRSSLAAYWRLTERPLSPRGGRPGTEQAANGLQGSGRSSGRSAGQRRQEARRP